MKINIRYLELTSVQAALAAAASNASIPEASKEQAMKTLIFTADGMLDVTAYDANLGFDAANNALNPLRRETLAKLKLAPGQAAAIDELAALLSPQPVANTMVNSGLYERGIFAPLNTNSPDIPSIAGPTHYSRTCG